MKTWHDDYYSGSRRLPECCDLDTSVCRLGFHAIRNRQVFDLRTSSANRIWP